MTMSTKRGVLAEDAVSVRQVRARGVSEPALRRQLAAVPVPLMRRFVFVRRVTLRAAPDQIGPAMATALGQLAEGGQSEMLAYDDFCAVVVACARASLTGGLGAWQWRTLGVPRLAGPGEAVATVLRAHPLQAGAVVAALAAQNLLAPVWRDLAEPVAAGLTHALAAAIQITVPGWPDEQAQRRAGTDRAQANPLVTRAAAFWAPVLAPLPKQHEAVRTAAVLALLRWSPMALQAADGAVWRAVLAGIAGAEPAPVLVHPPGPDTGVVVLRSDPVVSAVPNTIERRPTPQTATQSSAASPDAHPTALTPDDSLPGEAAGPAIDRPHGEVLPTAWGGVLFLVNALQRLDAGVLLAAQGAYAPTGFRLLHDLGMALGMPPEEPLAVFLASQDIQTTVTPSLVAHVRHQIEALYAPEGPWPLPLAQTGVVRATETHLDLELATTRVDLAVRLAGLDFDPGWVSWLGRVVSFHYPNIPGRSI